MSNYSLSEIALIEAAHLLHPLRTVSTSGQALALLNQLGYAVPAADLVQAFTGVSAKTNKVIAAAVKLVRATSDEEKLEAIPPLVLSVKEAVDEFAQLEAALRAAPGLAQDFINNAPLDQLPRRLLDFLLFQNLYRRYPKLFGALHLMGILEEELLDQDDAIFQPDCRLKVVRWERLPRYLSEPGAVVDDIYQWKTDFDSDEFFTRFALGMRAMAVAGGLYRQSNTVRQALGNSTAGLVEIRLPVFAQGVYPGQYAQFGFSLTPAEAASGQKKGLAFLPYLAGTSSFGFDFSQDWEASLQTNLNLDDGIGMVLRPPQSIDFLDNLFTNPSEAGSADFALGVRQKPVPGGQAREFYLFGAQGSTHLSVSGISLKLFGTLGSPGDDAGIELEIDKVSLLISGGDGDGFLQKVLPKEGIRTDFDLAIGWSSRKGLNFRGSAGLEVTLPINRTLFDALTIDSIYLAIKVSNKENKRPLRMIVAVTAHLKLGPVVAVVERMGLRADFDFPTNGDNLGPDDLALGFKPPDGAGISISTSIVSGGGYLSFNADAQQYAGAVYLELAGKFSLTALGLITTRMPDGKPGFSMLIIIAVEFSPGIQLGYGFMLTGIGGLLGINRTVNTEVLRSGIRTGMLNSVLFPKKVIENAPQIFSNLSAAFPPLEGHFIVGPAVKISWGGAVTIIAIELGIALEFAPAPQRLLIMGRLIASLPDAKNPIVHLQMDSLGIIDFVEGTISLDAVLYDSRIRELTISGGMALRVGWSKNAAFLLSVGGYHPDFRPPANFPVVDRLAIGLARGDNFRLRLESYFALTANTVQTGARLEIYAEAGGFSLAGFLGFDVLVHFNPFQFQAAIQAGVVLKRGNQVLMSITLDVTLTGPEPWLIDGRASFSILGFSHSIPIHHQIGDAKPEPPLEAVDLTGRLLEALRDEHNWSSSLPAGDHPLVALAEIAEGLRAAEPEKAKGKIWAHPAGNLTLRQRVVPLNQPIAKFGEAPVILTQALVVALDFGAGAPGLKVEIEQDQFAPAQFKEMSDAEKLSSPSFVFWDAGLRLALESVLISAHKDSPIGYEEKIITWDGNIVDAPAPAVLSPTDLDTLLPFGAVAQAPIRNTGRAIFAAPVLAQKSARRPA